MVAGEASGDALAAGLMEAIRAIEPEVVFTGVTGPRMKAAGCHSLADIESLSLIGLFEILRHLPRLHRLRGSLLEEFLREPPDVFVGIDAPDFNLGLEERLKRHGVPTVHYVSPTVWAWRPGRVQSVARAAHRVLTLFPFEARWYTHSPCEARYVGHPLADQLYPPPDAMASRQYLGLPGDRPILALLPGSRRSEICNHTEIFLQSAVLCQQAVPELELVVAAVNDEAAEHVHAVAAAMDAPPTLRMVVNDTHRVLAAADVALMASGTVALESMLIGTPMVVAYRMSWASYWLARCLVDLKQYSLPNILTGQSLVPEFIQSAAEPVALSRALLKLLTDADARGALRLAFAKTASDLRRGANTRAAEAVLELARRQTRRPSC